MVLESFADVPVLRGVLFGLVGVGVWVAGLLFFNWVWNYFRDDGEPPSGDNV